MLVPLLLNLVEVPVVTGATKLLQHFNGDATDVAGHTVSNSGLGFSSSIKRFGSGSISSAGVSSTTYVATTASADFDLNAPAWTLEFVFYVDSASVIAAGGSAGASWMLVDTTQGLDVELSFDGENSIILGPNLNDQIPSSGLGLFDPLTTGAWHHVALVADASSVRYYFNGIYYGSIVKRAYTGASNSIGVLRGANGLGAGVYVDEVRFRLAEVYTGSAIFEQAFIPPTQEFTLEDGDAVVVPVVAVGGIPPRRAAFQLLRLPIRVTLRPLQSVDEFGVLPIRQVAPAARAYAQLAELCALTDDGAAFDLQIRAEFRFEIAGVMHADVPAESIAPLQLRRGLPPLELVTWFLDRMK